MIAYEDLAAVNKPFLDEFRLGLDQVAGDGKLVLGNNLLEFEKEFSSYCGASFGVGVASGLDALNLIFRGYNFKPGSEVIVPANTYIASIFGILHAGLKPVLVDPDLETYNLEPERVERAVTRNTVAILAVHLYGRCAPMPELLSIARDKGLRLIEDCAQAHGAAINDKRAGSWGDAAAFSFYPTKNLGALGDAGMVVTSDAQLGKRVQTLRNYGAEKKDVHTEVGFNSRMDELQAVFLRTKLKALDRLNDHRREMATIYNKGLRPDFIRPLSEEGYHDVYHIYAIRHARRDELRSYLEKQGIGTLIHYPTPPHRQPALASLVGSAQFPVTEEIHSTELSLPVSSAHRSEQIEEVVSWMNRF